MTVQSNKFVQEIQRLRTSKPADRTRFALGEQQLEQLAADFKAAPVPSDDPLYSFLLHLQKNYQLFYSAKHLQVEEWQGPLTLTDDQREVHLLDDRDPGILGYANGRILFFQLFSLYQSLVQTDTDYGLPFYVSGFGLPRQQGQRYLKSFINPTTAVVVFSVQQVFAIVGAGFLQTSFAGDAGRRYFGEGPFIDQHGDVVIKVSQSAAQSMLRDRGNAVSVRQVPAEPTRSQPMQSRSKGQARASLANFANSVEEWLKGPDVLDDTLLAKFSDGQLCWIYQQLFAKVPAFDPEEGIDEIVMNRMLVDSEERFFQRIRLKQLHDEMLRRGINCRQEKWETLNKLTPGQQLIRTKGKEWILLRYTWLADQFLRNPDGFLRNNGDSVNRDLFNELAELIEALGILIGQLVLSDLAVLQLTNRNIRRQIAQQRDQGFHPGFQDIDSAVQEQWGNRAAGQTPEAVGAEWRRQLQQTGDVRPAATPSHSLDWCIWRYIELAAEYMAHPSQFKRQQELGELLKRILQEVKKIADLDIAALQVQNLMIMSRPPTDRFHPDFFTFQLGIQQELSRTPYRRNPSLPQIGANRIGEIRVRGEPQSNEP